MLHIQPDVKKLLEDHGAIHEGHFVLTSEQHSPTYLSMKDLEGISEAMCAIAQYIAISVDEQIVELGLIDRPVAIVGPKTLGLSFSILTASFSDYIKYYTYTETGVDEDGFDVATWDSKLKFHQFINGASVVIVDDVLTTGKSIKLVKQLVERTGGEVIGIIVIVDRSNGIASEQFNLPWFETLLSFPVESYGECDCPLCKAGVPVDLKPGHGEKWSKRPENAGYPTNPPSGQ